MTIRQPGRTALLHLLPGSERDVIHRVPAEAAVGIENVPFDEEGFLPGLRHALEFGKVVDHALVKFFVAQLMIRSLGFLFHDGRSVVECVDESDSVRAKVADDGRRVTDCDLDV